MYKRQVIGNNAWTATILSRPVGRASWAGVLKLLPNIFDLVTLPSCNKVFISLNPKFHKAKAFLGIRFLILSAPVPAVLFSPIPIPPSPIPNESPSEPPKSWLWQVAQAILRFADKILSWNKSLPILTFSISTLWKSSLVNGFGNSTAYVLFTEFKNRIIKNIIFKWLNIFL